MSRSAGEIVELRIESLAAGGAGVARLDGFVVFVPGTAPGDRVTARLERVRRRHARAELLEILEPGPARREPECPHAGTCGGCDWLHIDEAEQRRARAAIARDALRRIGGVEELPPVEELVSPSRFGYRSRARVAWAEGRVGFRAARSHDVVDVEHCGVLDADTQRGLDALRAERPAGAGEASIRGYRDRIDIAGRSLHVSPGSFFQANRALWEPWQQLVLELCGGGELAVELYAGSGFYTAGLDERFREVIAVERGPAAEDVRRNAKAKVVRSAAESWVASNLEGLEPDVILVNPPRAGCHHTVSQAIRDSGTRRVVYVSCDPSTLARDVRLLDSRYRIVRLFVVDAMPQTHHVEAAILLENVDPDPGDP